MAELSQAGRVSGERTGTASTLPNEQSRATRSMPNVGMSAMMRAAASATDSMLWRGRAAKVHRRQIDGDRILHALDLPHRSRPVVAQRAEDEHVPIGRGHVAAERSRIGDEAGLGVHVA